MHIAPEWVAFCEQIVGALTRVAGVLLTLGMAWNALHVIVDYATGSSRSVAQVMFNMLGLVLGFLMVALAPSIVSAIAGILIQPIFK